MFKSYYVVWKLEKQAIDGNWGVCLNRTMQYGNENNRRIKKNK